MAKNIQHWLATHYLDATFLAVLGGLGLMCGLWASVIILDDAMITFRVAENLAHGHGFVYNVGERVQVATTPLYAMVLAVGVWIVGSAPKAALALNVTLAALIPMLTYDVGRRLAGPLTGVGGAVLITTAPLLVIAFSMESYLYVALILACTNAYLARRYRLAGLLIGITGLTRGDAVLIGASILIYDVLAARRFRWGLIIPAIAIPAAWYLFATLYYGWPFPATLQAKTAQGELNWLRDYFLSGMGEYWEDWVEKYTLWFYLFPALIVVAFIPIILRTEWQWLILILHAAFYIATFEGLGVTFAEWYYAPLMPVLALLTGRGVQFIAQTLAWLSVRLLPKKTGLSRTVSMGAAALLLALLLTIMLPVTQDIVQANPNWKARAYPQAARWIAANTSPSANFATIDIGHLGYWSNRHIIDIVGLAQPDVAPHIAQGDFGYAIRHYQPDMVLLGTLWLYEVQTKDWFKQAYVPRHTLRLEGMDEPMTLFTRPEGVKVESDSIPPAKLEPLSVDFNRQIALVGYHLSRTVQSGASLELTLLWQVIAPLETDYTVFVQLVDVGNNIMAQNDSKPQHGFYTTPNWQPGERITDAHTVPINADVPPGTYEVLLGFYNADNGARLQILDEHGKFKSDHVRLTGLEVLAPQAQ